MKFHTLFEGLYFIQNSVYQAILLLWVEMLFDHKAFCILTPTATHQTLSCHN
jgi:hypothetical protein